MRINEGKHDELRDTVALLVEKVGTEWRVLRQAGMQIFIRSGTRCVHSASNDGGALTQGGRSLFYLSRSPRRSGEAHIDPDPRHAER
ncbi:hypothetical protein AURDEDRAFT_172849 [Auricularia subglabra TFB-10046 SS5]|uniref:Uncharacterized protein n=1 Tax=Auricularia subglabra (strain TFB-10046 / SS5) TaxID=717982 RepID=J0LIE3_AURST|nr:hypothetical protein AURDEDRAFT_172849 [Auricularia subglabra TFB-10046 SS5]